MRNVKKWGIFVAVCAVCLAVSFFVGSSGGKRKNAEPVEQARCFITDAAELADAAVSVQTVLQRNDFRKRTRDMIARVL